MMQLSVLPRLPAVSAGFVVARLFSSYLVSSPQWSVSSAFAPKVPICSPPKIRSWGSLPIFSRRTALFDVASAGICYDSSVLRLLNEEDAQEIDLLVQERSKARWQGNYTVADNLKAQILEYPNIPSGYELILKDIPRNEGGGSQWNLVHTKEIYDEDILSGSTILQLAHAAMGLAVQDNQQKQTQRGREFRLQSLEALVQKAKLRLEILLEETRKMDEINSIFEVSTKNTMVQSELGGRTAADAALWFAFAGSKDEDLFDKLADIAAWELHRFGTRPSFQKKYTLQIAERFAAAGLRRHERLEQVVGACLSEKQAEDDVDGSEVVASQMENNQPTYLDLHSNRSLLLIWKLATKQKKQRSFLRELEMENNREALRNENTNDSTESSRNDPILKPTYDWNKMFEDPHRPVVLDIGCGMGVSLLGLASTKDDIPGSQESSQLLLDESLSWSDCNFVGVDLGALGIEYARGVAHRWNMVGKNLYFAIDAAEDFCKHLESYPGEIRCCMIQFPTPFRLQNKGTGNSQLPASQLEGFMVTENLLNIIRATLHPSKGKLLLQSNCEDVAVWMRNLASKKVGFAIVEDDSPLVDSTSSTPQRLPQRTAEWIEMGGERAEGEGWYQREVLHRKGATETEVSCAINGTPVHRCILKVNKE